MNHKITGCADCPLFDSAKGEYGRWCNHPNRKVLVQERILVDSDKTASGKIYEMIPVDNEEKYKYFSGLLLNSPENNIRVDDEGREYFIQNEPIINYPDVGYSPDWCPLNSELLMIVK